MLVLCRKKTEEIIIGDSIRIKVIDVQGGKVRLGLSAPPEISIHRKEVYDLIHKHHGAHSKTRELFEPRVNHHHPGLVLQY